jgi:dTDP-4-dehydrorhamnose reductase
LGRAILSQCPAIFAPGRHEMDVSNYEALRETIKNFQPRIVIHSAALVGKKECEADPQRAEQVNVTGTRNVMLACKESKAMLVFISTAAVFDGKKGTYSEDDVPKPQYLYAETKLRAEKIVSKLENHLIIRTDFFDPMKFKYDGVFTDHFCSKEPTAAIAKKVLHSIKIGTKGLLHLGGARGSLYDILKPFFPSITPIRISDSSMPDFPRDISLSSKVFPQ